MQIRKALLFVVTAVFVSGVFLWGDPIYALGTIITKSPSLCQKADAIQWTNCDLAYADDWDQTSAGNGVGGSASGATHRWYNYGYQLADTTIEKVEVRLVGVDLFSVFGAPFNSLEVSVSNDGGNSFGPVHTISPGQNVYDQDYTINVTNDRTWTLSSVNGSNLQVKVKCITPAAHSTLCEIGWIPVSITVGPFF